MGLFQRWFHFFLGVATRLELILADSEDRYPSMKRILAVLTSMQLSRRWATVLRGVVATHGSPALHEASLFKSKVALDIAEDVDRGQCIYNMGTKKDSIKYRWHVGFVVQRCSEWFASPFWLVTSISDDCPSLDRLEPQWRFLQAHHCWSNRTPGSQAERRRHKVWSWIIIDHHRSSWIIIFCIDHISFYYQ